MTKEFVYHFIQAHSLAVLASISPEGNPEAALVGIAVSPDLDIIFDTLTTSRKYANLKNCPRIALVIGWDDETTLQYEGDAEELYGPQAGAFKEIYFEKFSDGRLRADTWPGLVHFRIRPEWIRYSHFLEPAQIEELRF